MNWIACQEGHREQPLGRLNIRDNTIGPRVDAHTTVWPPQTESRTLVLVSSDISLMGRDGGLALLGKKSLLCSLVGRST
jgi:hypothetical protein